MRNIAIPGIFALILLLLLPGAVSAADVTVSGSILKADLNVTAITPNTNAVAGSYGGELFANEPNIIVITIANQGTEEAGASTLSVDIGGTLYTAPVGNLAAGATTKISIDDATLRAKDASVIITATADSTGIINEGSEINNALTVTKTVFYNGYKGKRFTNGSDITTVNTFELRGNLIYSVKADNQGSGSWTSKTIAWTSGDLPVPSGATIVDARLSVPYNWDQYSIMPGGVSVTFNGVPVTQVAHYTDRKGFGGSNYPSGLIVYDVKSAFSTSGNSATITRTSGSNGPALNGMILTVIYQYAGSTEKVIFINEEADYLRYNSTQPWVSSAEATAFAPFTGPVLTPSAVASAKLITITQSAKPAEGSVVFNGYTFNAPWTGGTDSTMGVSEVSVGSYLTATGNGAEFHTVLDNDLYVATHAILIVEKSEATVTADFTPATQQSGDNPFSVTFTDASTGYITSWDIDFGDGSAHGSGPGPWDHQYTTRGTYNITLAVTGIGSSDTETKNALVVVREPAPAIDFTGTPVTGTSPLNVAFTATNTGGQVDSWLWNFGDGQTSGEQNPTHQYQNEGTYTVNLTATGPDYTDTKTRNNYIQVGAATIDVSVTPAGISFGTMTAGVDSTNSTQVAVTTTGGTAWSVTAAANNGGYMKSGSNQLASAFQLANGGGTFHAMTTNFASFMTGTADEDRTDTANVKQAIAAADAPGSYSITLTFTGGFS